MRLSIVSDDISLDLSTTLEVLQDHNCREFELRQLGLSNFMRADSAWLSTAEKAVHNKRFRVTSLVPGFFLEAAPSDEEIKRVFEIAQRLKCNCITIYAAKMDDSLDEEDENDADEEFDGPPLPPAIALDPLRNFVKLAAGQNIQVNLRSHPDSYAGTAEETINIVKAISTADAPLGLDWDVGACFAAGDDSGLDTLPDVLPLLKSVHVRDAVRKGISADWASLGKGVIPWEDILEQLYDGGYRGPVVLESGLPAKLREARASLPLLGRWIDACRLRKRPSRNHHDD